MRPAVAVHDEARLSPVWLRPGALGLVACVHLAVFLGVPWPAGPRAPQPAPIEIEVSPPAVPTLPALEPAKVQAIEVRPASAVKPDAHAAESQPLAHGRSTPQIKPPEPVFATNAPPLAPPAPAGQLAQLPPLEMPRPAINAETAQGPVKELASPKLRARPAAPPARQSSSQALAETPLPVSRPVPQPRPAALAGEALGAGAPVAATEAARPLSPLADHVAEAGTPATATPVTAARAPGEAHEAQRPAPLVQSEPSPPAHLSGQRVVESLPLDVSRPVAHPQPAGPAREAPGGGAPVAATEAARPLSPLADHVAEAGTPAAATPVTPARAPGEAREAQRPAPLVQSEPSPPAHLSGQRVVETVPLDVSRPLAPAQTPTLDEILPAPTAEGARRVEEDDGQVARIAPLPAMKGPSLREQGPQRPERIEKIVRYVEQYDGGNCFYVAPVEVSETKARLEGYGASDEPFRALNDAFLHENGYEAAIDVRLVAPAQCPAVTFLGRLRGVSAPHLRIDGTRLSPGAPLTGAVDGSNEGSVELLLVTDSGAVQNVSRLLKPDRSGESFTIAYPDLAKGSAGQPQLLIAIATLKPFEALRFDGAVAATRLFPALLAEGLRTNQPVAAIARYFKVEE